MTTMTGVRPTTELSPYVPYLKAGDYYPAQGRSQFEGGKWESP